MVDLFINEDSKKIKKFGIYKITNEITNKCYIGSTTESFYQRWVKHLYSIKTNKGCNKPLKNAVDKHGLFSMKFEIIEIVDNKEEVIEREQYWINHYNSYENGYNCTPKAGNTLGFNHSKKTKLKLSKKVSQFNLDGSFIKTFNSLKEASILTNTDYITLSNACNLKIKQANNFQWRLGESKKNINSIGIKNSKKIGKFDENNNKICEYKSIKEASITIKKASNTLSTAIKRQKMCGNFYWKIL